MSNEAHTSMANATLLPRLRSVADDFRYGLRGLRNAPGFAASAVLTLALGMGALITTFGVVDSVLLRPLPYIGSDRIVSIVERGAQTRQDMGLPHRCCAHGKRGPTRYVTLRDTPPVWQPQPE